MRRTAALRSALAALTTAILIALLGVATASAAAAGGKPGGGGNGGTCRKCATTSSSTSSTTTSSTTSTTVAPTTTTTTAPAGEPAPMSADPSDVVITDPGSSGTLDPLLRTRLIQWGPVTGVLYLDAATYAPSVWWRDHTSGATGLLDLPSDSRQGWAYAAAAMTGSQDLWVAGGTGPITLRHYVLSGAPLPTTAALVETRAYGNADSRPGDLLALADGSLVLAWHQQGNDGPQGQHVAFRSASGVWSELPALTFMPTSFSDQVLGQHPADGSVWLFSNPDMWGAVGAARLVEQGDALAVTASDGTFLSEQRDGLNGPDPENADLALAADPSTGTLALAYQSRDRRYVGQAGTTRVVSRVVVASVAASGARSFLVSPAWAERVADTGLVVETGGAVAVTYRPVDETTGAFKGLEIVRFGDGTWSPSVPLGNGSLTAVAYASGRTEVAGLADDWAIHVLTPSP